MPFEPFASISVTMFSEEEVAVRDMVSSWCKAELQPHVREMDREGEMKVSEHAARVPPLVG